MHILLIDDSSSTRSLLRTLINSGQSVRHDISEAASGEEALQKVGSGEINLPDLVIVDINMAGMTGYEFCTAFRAKHGTGSDLAPYIIVVTANEGVDVINQALDSGANDYMPKPVNVKILQVRLRVAERLLSHVNPASVTKSGKMIDPTAPAAEPAPVAAAPDPLTSLIASSIEYVDAPISIVETSGGQPNFNIIYANAGMSATTQYTQDQLNGKSIAEVEGWTQEFVAMVLSFIERNAIISHVPLWSETRQAVPIHLSFYPIRAEGDQVNSYLVIHHF